MTDAPSRLLPLVGAYNFRDLGGYPTTDGRRTQRGRLFRSDTLGELTAADLAILRDLGLATVLDLRSPTEASRDGRGLLADEPVRYFNLPMFDDGAINEVAPEPIDGDLGLRYLWYLSQGRASMVTAVTEIATASSLPLVFHCTAGKDRTGVLAALVLSILGVEHDVIVADYVETQASLHLILERLRNHPVFGEKVRAGDIPADRFQVQASSMQSFLAGMEREHGGSLAWLVAQGLDPSAADRLRDLLLEG